MVLKIIRAESGNDSLGVTKRQMYSRAAGQDDRSLWNRVWKAAVLAVYISPECAARHSKICSDPPRLSLSNKGSRE